MLQLGAISHPNPLVDQKVKYFHDCFHYYLLESAKRIEGFPENHLTYIERMLFRVETLSKMHQSSRMTICSWLEQPEFDTNNDEFAKQPTIKPLVIRLKQIASQTGDKFDLKLFQETAIKIVEELNGADGLNGSLYFYEILKSQISVLICVHNLEEHAEEIMKNSRWMVAEYLRHGFDAKELSGLNSVFRRIMKFGELKTSKKPHSVGFPLPPELKEKRNSKRFKSALKKYLENNGFATQFEGMLNALKETQNGDIYFRLNDIKKHGDDKFLFSYAGVTLLSFDQISSDQIRLNEQIKKDFDKYFGTPNSVIAKVPMIFKSKEQAILMAKYKTYRTLNALQYVLGGKGGTVSTNRVLIAWSEGGADYQMNSERSMRISRSDIELLQDFNQTILYPENISVEVRRYLDRCNQVFFKGIACEDPDDMISHFWQYWETAFGFYEQKGKAERVISDLSLILSKDSAPSSKKWLGVLIHDYATNNNGNTDVGIPRSYYGRKFDFDNPASSVQEVKAYTSYPFLKMLINRFELMNPDAEGAHWQKFYKNFLWQLYEQRNFILHDGTYCSATLERLKFFFRAIVVRWQAKLFEELERIPNSTIEDTVDRLITNSHAP